ncbi:MAG: hypothetical protein IJ038_02065 [Clostridia bacterium]|nr:hypothetical protein [Clostridia bacterium]
MKNYIVTLICVSLICGFIGVLSPDGERGGLKKHINLVASLCVLCVALAPLGSILTGIENMNFNFGGEYFNEDELEEKYDEIYKDNLGNYTAASIAVGSERLVCERFGMNEEDFEIRVSVVCYEDSFETESAALIIYPSGIAKEPREISEYISSLLGCECQIIYK